VGLKINSTHAHHRLLTKARNLDIFGNLKKSHLNTILKPEKEDMPGKTQTYGNRTFI